jgi:hypothetical protein
MHPFVMKVMVDGRIERLEQEADRARLMKVVKERVEEPRREARTRKARLARRLAAAFAASTLLVVELVTGVLA